MAKMKWSKPVLERITPTEAVDRLMRKSPEASAAPAAHVSTGNVVGNEEIVSLRREIAELTQSLAAFRVMLAERQSKLGVSESPPPTTASNANADYRPPYQEEGSSRQTGRKRRKN